MKNCKKCGNPHEKNGMYCSRSCSQKGRKITQEHRDKIRNSLLKSEKAREGIEKVKKENKLKYKEFDVNCFTCKIGFSVLEYNRESPKKEKYFCGRNCANKYAANANLEKRRENISKGLKGNPKVIEAAKNAKKPLRAPRYKTNCLYCNEEITSTNPDRKYHGECFKKVSGGKREGSGRGEKGWYKGIFCDSSWELAFVIYKKDREEKIERNTEWREYTLEEKTRKYLPDFVTQEGIVEIKGFKTKEWEQKHKENSDVIVFYKKEMKPILEYVKTKYGNDFIKLYEDKNNSLYSGTCKYCGAKCKRINTFCNNSCSRKYRKK
jgi:hypothetical protein